MAYMAAWHLAHKESENAKSRIWYAKHREQHKALARARYDADPEQKRDSVATYQRTAAGMLTEVRRSAKRRGTH